MAGSSQVNSEGGYLARSIRRRKIGREVMTEKGKQGDKVKECRETTVPLFVLKELPHHSAPMGNYEDLTKRRGINPNSKA